MLEVDYPYTGRDGNCRYDGGRGVTTLTGTIASASGDEDALKEAVYDDGVGLVWIDGSGVDFQLYTGGIYNPATCSSTSVNTILILVGYGVEDGVPYWILENFWGDSWGEHGYIRIIRNAGNKCGVATRPVFPVDTV
jgi:cathepsin L